MSEDQIVGIDVSSIKFPKVMDLRTAAIYLEIGEMRVRTLARDEELPSHKNDAGHWRFNLEDLKAFKADMGTKRGGYRRGDRKFWRIQVKHEDLDAVIEVLKPFGIEVTPQYQYEKKEEGEEGKGKEVPDKAPVGKGKDKKGVFGG